MEDLWPAYETKMKAEGLNEAAIAAFKHNFGVLVSGQSTLIPESAIGPVKASVKSVVTSLCEADSRGDEHESTVGKWFPNSHTPYPTVLWTDDSAWAGLKRGEPWT